MTNTTAPAAAELIAPLEQLTGQCCQLERLELLVEDRDGDEDTEQVVINPDGGLAAAIYAKNRLFGAGWTLKETWVVDHPLPQVALFVDVEGNEWYEF